MPYTTVVESYGVAASTTSIARSRTDQAKIVVMLAAISTARMSAIASLVP